MVRPSVTGNGRLSALMTPTLTVCDSPNGLPIAITQSPGCICAESPNLASGSAWSGFSVSSISALSVSGSRPTTRARYRMSSSSPYNETSTLSAPSTTWLFVRMRPSFAMMKPVPAATVVGGAPPRLGWRGCPKKRRNNSSPPPKNSVSSCSRCRDSVRMLTTVGETVLAMFRNVWASTGPDSGALLAAGTARVCAADSGDKSIRDAMTMPTATEATAMSTA